MEYITYCRRVSQDETKLFSIEIDGNTDIYTIKELINRFNGTDWYEEVIASTEFELKTIKEIIMKGEYYDGRDHFYLHITTADSHSLRSICLPFDNGEDLLDIYSIITGIMHRRGF
jgi:hypothetical protein